MAASADFGNIAAKEAVLVALSGGADSVALLHMAVSRFGSAAITAAHVNHHLRGDEADGDEAFCAAYCRKLGVDIVIAHVDVLNLAKTMGFTTEQAARIARYEALERIRAEKGAAYILTAHHMDDNAETVLMRLFRGSGAAGLSGIPYRRGNILRPLLNIPRPSILRYCEENGLAYVEDSTNEDDSYTRNLIRNKVLAAIRSGINENVGAAISRAARQAAQDDDYMTNEARLSREAILENGGIDIGGLKALHPAIAGRVIRLEIQARRHDLIDISSQNIEDALSIINKQSGRSIDIGGGFRVGRRFNTLCVYKPSLLNYEYSLIPNTWVHIVEADISVMVGEGGLTARTRRPGDRYHGKPLKEFFIKRKIPIERRDALLTIANGKDILYIQGIGGGIAVEIKEGKYGE